jgi:hypothetical protein
MYKKIYQLIFVANCLIGCGPDRSFENKNIYGSATSASSSTGYVEQMWPEGDYGVKLGQIIPETLGWKGYGEHQSSASATDLTSRSWYDPSGELDIDAVLVTTVKHDCNACITEAELMQNRITSWYSQSRMIKVVTLLTDSQDGGIVNVNSVLEWKSIFYQLDASVGADPLMVMLPENVFALPYHTIVDPRTMRVVGTQEGIVDDYKILEDLADSNNFN